MTHWLRFLAETVTVALIFGAVIWGVPIAALALGVPLR
jgi:hypothetical protein